MLDIMGNCIFHLTNMQLNKTYCENCEGRGDTNIGANVCFVCKGFGRKLNNVFNEDCLFTMAKMPNDFVDMTLTSPPYDNLRDYKGYSFDFESIAKELFRITKQGGVVVWVVGDAVIDGSESGTSFTQALFFMKCGFFLHDTMIYDKGKVIFPDANRYHNCFEFMFVFSKGKPKTVNLIKDRKNKWSKSWGKRTYRQKDGTRKQKEVIELEEIGVRYNIWTIQNGFMHTTLDEYAYEHPAMFPEKLAQDHIKSWSNEGDLVYDPMIGSGTTGKMAVMLKRNYIGSEISAEYTKLAEDRIKSISNPLF